MSLTDDSIVALENAIRARGATRDGKEIRFLAPCHDDHNPSARWNPEKRTWYCDVCCRGGGWKDLARRLEVHVIASGNGAGTLIIATYAYHDEQGTLLYEVVRFEPKGFRQRRPDGNGDWIYNLHETRRVPYRLQTLVRDFSHPVCFHEGEKAVEAALAAGLPGVHTTTSGGAGNGHLTDLSACGGREVLIVPDHDEPGRRYALTLAARLTEIGATSVRIVTLPHVPEQGDIVEWLMAGGTPEQFERLCEVAPLWLPGSPDAATPEPVSDATAPLNGVGGMDVEQGGDRPELNCDGGDFAALTRRAWGLVAAEDRPYTLYKRGTLVVRAEDDENRQVRLAELTEARGRHEVARLTRCTKTKRSPFGGGSLGPEDCKPPMDLIRNMLAASSNDIPLPILRGIVEVPVISAAGLLVQAPGYDRASQLLYRPYDPTVTLVIPTHPSTEDLGGARTLIDELLTDFPFASNADRTNTIACMIQPFVRMLIDGPTPLYLVEAPGPGIGKTLLVESLLLPAVGRHVGIIADARDDDEMRKRITARLLEGCPVTLFDNITRPMDSGVISAALTAIVWQDRRLGKLENISVPVVTQWLMTANNPTMSVELARRTVRIRLDPQQDRPWQRDGFRHPNLRGWVEQERAAFIRAVLILVQRWLAAGSPAPTVKPLGSFESWSQVVGGIVAFAGYTDFMGNAQAFYEVADSDGAIWRTFTEQWWATHKDQVVTVKDLFTIAEQLDGLYLGKATSERAQRTALGGQLKKRRDQVIGSYRIEAAGSSNNAALWRLRRMGVPAPAPATESEEDLYHVA